MAVGVLRMLRKKHGVHVESMIFPDEEHGAFADEGLG